MSDLYDSDIVTWSERQADLLRRSVGRSQVDAVESLLFRAFVHDLKAAAWPLSREVPGWQGEARGSRAQARRRYQPSMHQKLDIQGLYTDALQALPETIDGQKPQPVPAICPVTLDDLMAD